MLQDRIESPELLRTRVLNDLKARMAGCGNDTPFRHRVATDADLRGILDVPELHAKTRDAVVGCIRSVQETGRSGVVLVAGAAGSGKTHLLKQLQKPEAGQRAGFVYVGGNNEWGVGDFHHRLLDWLVAALANPNESGGGRLWTRVADIGFKAAELLLDNPLAQARILKTQKGRFFARLLGRNKPVPPEVLREMLLTRDPSLFAFFQYGKFAQYVCDRFLADSGNPVHRYALQVLLSGLFPDDDSPTLGNRERAVHWFRGRPDDGKMRALLGVDERLDKGYKAAEAVQLFVHLFSPEVSKSLSSEAHACKPLTFLFGFDQAEGREELFEKESDWRDFFAHLAEIYNSLPNSLVVFTMTLKLRDHLLKVIERQFKDRVTYGDDFILKGASVEQLARIYRLRLLDWVRSEPALAESVERCNEATLPFSAEEFSTLAVGEAKEGTSVRDRIAAIDVAFTDRMDKLVVAPGFDYQFALNKYAPPPTGNPYDYTRNHYANLQNVVGRLAKLVLPQCSVRVGVAASFDKATQATVPVSPAVLQLRFDYDGGKAWVVAYLLRLGKNVNQPAQVALGLLRNRLRARHSLWLVRAQPFNCDAKPYADQTFCQTHANADEARLRALGDLLDKTPDYPEADRAEANTLAREAVATTYLGKLFDDVRRRMDQLTADPAPAPVEEPEVSLSFEGLDLSADGLDSSPSIDLEPADAAEAVR